MPIFNVKAPDGSIITVNGPDGSTEAQAIEYAKSQYTSPITTPTIEVTPEKQKYSGASSGSRAVAQGLTFGFADEIEAKIREGLGQGNYKDIRNDIRKQQEAFQKDNPALSAALEIGGSLALPTGVVGLGAKSALKGGQTLLKTIGKGTATGASAGAITGAGVAPEMKDVGTYAGQYAGIGGVLGGAAVPALNLAGKTVKNLAQGLGLGDANKIATKKLSETLQKENLTPSDVQTVLNEYRGLGVPEATIADLGTNLQNLGYSSYIVPSRAKTGTEAFLQERGASLPGQLVEGLTKKSNLTSNKFGYDYINDLATKQVEQARIAYPKAYEKDIPITPFTKYFDRDVFKTAYKEAQKRADVEGISLPELENLKAVKKVPTDVLHQIKIGLDRVVEKETDSITGKVSGYGSDVVKVRKEFNDLIKAQNPLYAQANKKFADSLEVQNAYKTGADYLKVGESELVKNLQSMKPAQKEAFRIGMVSKIQDNLSTFEGVDFTKKIFGSDRKRSALRYAFDNQQGFDDFVKQLEGQRKLLQTQRKVLGGSQTQERAMLTEDLGMANDIIPLAQGNILGTIANIGRRGIAQGRGISPATAEQLQSKLFTTNPQEQYGILQDIINLRNKQQNQSILRQPGLYSYEAGVMPGLLSEQ